MKTNQAQKPSSPARSFNNMLIQRKCACSGSAGSTGRCEKCKDDALIGYQPKLHVNQPGDRWEKEADRVAGEIVTGDKRSSPITPVPTERFQRSSQNNESPSETSIKIGNGRPLDPEIRGKMEYQFGHDFSRVRIHSDSQAAAAATSLNARAFTQGQNIAFDSGQYSTATQTGQQLLAHELTHSIQQASAHASNNTIQRQVNNTNEENDVGTSQHSKSNLAICKSKTYEGAKIDVNTSAFMAEFWPEDYIPKLYIDLKKARKCFPEFTEDVFLKVVEQTKIFSREQRKRISKQYNRRSIRKDDRRMIWRESQKPFAGYKTSGFDASSRFLTKGAKQKLGYSPTAKHKPWKNLITTTLHRSRDGSWDHTKSKGKEPIKGAQAAFSDADVLVFSGHQYAQYKAPGLWSNDDVSEFYDTRTLKGPLNNVKLLISTSCATICKEPANIWKGLFPKAVFLGYRKTAPGSGAGMANSFAKNLPKDLLFEAGGASQAVDAWKSAIKKRHKGDKKREPGWLDIGANMVNYWNGKNFVSVKADSNENACKIKGDNTSWFPDPRIAQPGSGSLAVED